VRTVEAEPLTVSGFQAFGDVVSASLREGSGKSANQGTAVRFDHIAAITSTRERAKANLAVFRSVAKSLPFEVKLLERHPCSSQMFVPMRCARYLVVVCEEDALGAPDLETLRAFVCREGQGFNYKPGLWHHPIIALDAAAEFIMLAYEDGTPLDCEERPLSESVWVTLS
jgi:ureidoglycolate lyase